MIIREKYLSKIRPFNNKDLIKVIIGIRGSGKTVILKQIINELVNSGIDKEQIIYINFEFEDYYDICNHKDFNKYIEDLRLNKDELKQLIIDNPDAYIVSVTELNKNIDYLKEHNYPIETIKKFFITNPQLISMSNKEFISVVKCN